MGQTSGTQTPINAYALASQYLIALGWPNTSANQRALAAWFMAESARGPLNTIDERGYNPLNISGCANYRLVGTHKICVFNSQAEGIAAFQSLISSPNHNYPGIVVGFRRGTGAPAIAAIINSGWVPGGNGPSYWHTVNGVRSNLLQQIYNGLPGGSVTIPPPTGVVPIIGTAGPKDPNNYCIFYTSATSAFCLPKGTTFTQADASALMDYLDQNGFYGNNGLLGVAARLDVESDIRKLEGTPFNETWNRSLSTAIGVDASQADPSGAIAGAIGGLGQILNSITGGIALKIPFAIALVGAGIMGLFGVYLITKEATAGGQSESLVSPVPVFLREGA